MLETSFLTRKIRGEHPNVVRELVRVPAHIQRAADMDERTSGKTYHVHVPAAHSWQYMLDTDLIRHEVPGIDLIKLRILDYDKHPEIIPLSYDYLPQKFPQAGDIVRLDGDGWHWGNPNLEIGDRAIIGGPINEYQEKVSITFHPYYPIFRTKSSHGTGPGFDEMKVQVGPSGGPVTEIDIRNLKPTEDTQEVVFQRWHDLPRAHSAETYRMPAKIWSWDGLHAFENEGRFKVIRTGRLRTGKFWVVYDQRYEETRGPRFYNSDDAETMRAAIHKAATHGTHLDDYQIEIRCKNIGIEFE